MRRQHGYGEVNIKIVLDANVLVALSIPLPYSHQATSKMSEWQSAEIDLFAPLLLAYEFATALRKAIVIKMLTMDEAHDAISDFSALNIQMVPPTRRLHQRALWWSEQLQQKAAYDAQYLALAEQLGAALWTADKRLANGTQQIGIAWVHWISASE